MIEVVNKYKHTPTANDIYIGRGSPLGNPFSHITGSTALIHCETREEAIIKYEEYLQEAINTKFPNICNELNKLWGLAKDHDVYLVCTCKPKSCHGDIIKKIIEDKF